MKADRERHWAYVCEAGATIGWGHLQRGRAIAELHGNFTFVIGGDYAAVKCWAAQHLPDIAVTQWASTGLPWADSGPGAELVLVDSYSVDSEWIADSALKRPTVVLDDWMRASGAATLLVNPNLGARRDDYIGFSASDFLLGSEYTLLRGEILAGASSGRPRPVSPVVLITLGGGDSSEVARQIVLALAAAQLVPSAVVDVILGPTAGVPVLPEDLRGSVKLTMQPGDFVSRCGAASVVLCGASTTSYELAYLGVPFIPLVFADNQSRIGREWNRVGVSSWDLRYPDWEEPLTAKVRQMILEPESANEIVRTSRCLVNGGGAQRVVSACEALAVSP